MQNPLIFDNSSIIGRLINSNNETPLPDFNITKAQGAINNFTNNLKSEFQSMSEGDSQILLAYRDGQSILGKLRSNGEFEQIAQISKEIEIFRFYNETTYLYAVNSFNSQLSELYLQTNGESPVLIKRLSSNQNFIDAHFSIVDQSFYYTFFDQNSTVFLEATDVKGVDYSIYSSNFLKSNTRIWSVSTTNGYIYLNQGRECFSLMLRDRLLESFECQNIVSNNQGSFYWSNDSTSDVYTTFTGGQLYRFTFGELERKVLVSKPNGEVITNPWVMQDRVYFISSILEPISTREWQSVPTDIEFVDISTAQAGSLNLSSIKDDIDSIIPIEQNLFITTKEDKGFNKIFRYNPNPVIESPTSYPASGPVSMPVVKDPKVLYWEELDLGFDYRLIQVLRPTYTYSE